MSHYNTRMEILKYSFSFCLPWSIILILIFAYSNVSAFFARQSNIMSCFLISLTHQVSLNYWTKLLSKEEEVTVINYCSKFLLFDETRKSLRNERAWLVLREQLHVATVFRVNMPKVKSEDFRLDTACESFCWCVILLECHFTRAISLATREFTKPRRRRQGKRRLKIEFIF